MRKSTAATLLFIDFLIFIIILVCLYAHPQSVNTLTIVAIIISLLLLVSVLISGSDIDYHDEIVSDIKGKIQTKNLSENEFAQKALNILMEIDDMHNQAEIDRAIGMALAYGVTSGAIYEESLSSIQHQLIDEKLLA